MEALEAKLKTVCFQAPHWQQLLLQAFWFGITSWAYPALETNKSLKTDPITLQALCHHADPEFESWPLEWLQPMLDEFRAIPWTLDSLDIFSEHLENIFQDCVPTDLHVYHVLNMGTMLTEEQWIRLYDSLAFRPPPLPPTIAATHKRAKTRRIHGKRALTPIKRRRAITHHKPHLQVIKLAAK